MSAISRTLKRSTLPVLIVLCLAALAVSYAYAEGPLRPLATQIIGDPDAAVTGKLAVGTATPGNKALTVVGVIDFLGAGTVHNYFTQGGGNNMQINTNVDEANAVVDATKSQWKLVLGSSLDWFSIRRSPAGGTYNEDALFFIEGSTGRVGIATVDTGNAGAIPFGFYGKLHVQTDAEDNAIFGLSLATSGTASGIYGVSEATGGYGVRGNAEATTGTTYGVFGQSNSTDGFGVYGITAATTGYAVGVYGRSDSSTNARGVKGEAMASSGPTFGVFGRSHSTSGTGVAGFAAATTGGNIGVYGQTNSPDGIAVMGNANGGGRAANFTGDVNIDGGLNVTGQATGFFPRPAYDSGWVDISGGAVTTLTHSLGGDIDRYFVDFYCKNDSGVPQSSDKGSTYWYNLTSSAVDIRYNDPDCVMGRVRIWVIN